MKRYIFTAILCAATAVVFAQTKTTTTTTQTTVTVNDKGDTVEVRTDTVRTRKKLIKFSLNTGERTSAKSDSSEKEMPSKAPGFSWGITFARFDLGLATLVDNGSFNLSPTNNFLRYRSWKSSNVGFDILQAGYRFNSAFRIYVSAGLDWTHLRLRENITIQQDGPDDALRYTQDNINYSKNRFTSSYIRIPLTFDWRSRQNDAGKRFHITGGPMVGFLYNGRVKQISGENGKEKFNNTYHFAKVRYGLTGRVGYGALGVFAKYYFNDMFDTAAQEGLRNFSFGLMFGF